MKKIRAGQAMSSLVGIVCAGTVTACAGVGAARFDGDTITARNIAIIDEEGNRRLLLTSRAPDPVIDGHTYHRVFPAAGMIIYDRDGRERGGYAILDTDTGSIPVLTLDQRTSDAIGWRVMPDGSVEFLMNQQPDMEETGPDGVPRRGLQGYNRIRMRIAADGAPTLELLDQSENPRLRLTTSQDGQGAIEFLAPNGTVQSRLDGTSLAPAR